MPDIGLSNLQKELLQLYGNNVSEQTLKEIKGVLARFFAEKATNSMDLVWDDQKLTPEDMTRWANEHNRTEGFYR